jgi:CheY-like chemotaxis protein
LLVDYRLDDGTGIEAIMELRRRFGADLPAILITAHRSLRLRGEARVRNIQFLNKPLRPAALRALMAQYRIQRIAAAE